ncbi:MAG: hypothetical protein HIU86_03195 [Acidobacteria bacterium]|nr:hypothetical protein [Acidobacteriota bacterium]
MVRHLDASLLSPGQVLLVDDPDHPGRLRLHRLVEIGQDGRLITNGDANRNEESSPVQVTALHGAAFLRIPYAGLPAYWICTGQVAPLVTSVALVGLLLGGVRLGRLLEDPEERERRRHRGIRLRGLHRAAAAVGALGVLSAPAIMPAAAAHAAFAAMTSTTGNTWGTACTDRAPGTGMTPSLHYGYGPGSTDIPDLGLRRRFDAVRRRRRLEDLAPPDRRQHRHVLQGRPHRRGGVLADFGSSNTAAASAGVDDGLYMGDSGRLTFGAASIQAAGLVKSAYRHCTTSGGYADCSWHLVVATVSTTSGCTISVDADPATTWRRRSP